MQTFTSPDFPYLTHSITTLIINHFKLPPNTQSINFLNQIKSFKIKQFTAYYIFHDNQFHLLYTYNHFLQLSSPITPHFTKFATLQQLQNSI